MTMPEKLLAEMNTKVKTPGMADIIWMPIQTRTEMLTTGFRTKLGVKVFGADLQAQIESVAVNGGHRKGASRPAGTPAASLPSAPRAATFLTST